MTNAFVNSLALDRTRFHNIKPGAARATERQINAHQLCQD